MAIALFLIAGGEEWVPRGLCPLWGVRAGGLQSSCLHSCHLPLYKDVSCPHFPYPGAVPTLLLTDALDRRPAALAFLPPWRLWTSLGGRMARRVHTMSTKSALHLPWCCAFPLSTFSGEVPGPLLLELDPQWRFTFLFHSSCLITMRRWQGASEIQIR